MIGIETCINERLVKEKDLVAVVTIFSPPRPLDLHNFAPSTRMHPWVCLLRFLGARANRYTSFPNNYAAFILARPASPCKTCYSSARSIFFLRYFISYSLFSVRERFKEKAWVCPRAHYGGFMVKCLRRKKAFVACTSAGKCRCLFLVHLFVLSLSVRTKRVAKVIFFFKFSFQGLTVGK